MPQTVRFRYVRLLTACSLLAFAMPGCGNGEASEAEKQADKALIAAGAQIKDKNGRVVILNFSGADIGTDDFANLGKCERLEELLLRGAKFDEGDIAQLSGLSRIARISLKETELTDVGLKHLGSLTSLEEIDLEKTQVTDAGLNHLTGLKKLKRLYLSGSQATLAGVAKLKKSLPNLKVSGP